MDLDYVFQSLYDHDYQSAVISNQPRSREIMNLVASVRLSVRVFVCAVTDEPFDLWPWSKTQLPWSSKQNMVFACPQKFVCLWSVGVCSQGSAQRSISVLMVTVTNSYELTHHYMHWKKENRYIGYWLKQEYQILVGNNRYTVPITNEWKKLILGDDHYWSGGGAGGNRVKKIRRPFSVKKYMLRGTLWEKINFERHPPGKNKIWEALPRKKWKKKIIFANFLRPPLMLMPFYSLSIKKGYKTEYQSWSHQVYLLQFLHLC